MSATQTYGANIAFIEELYDKYRNNPNEVSPSWREFFGDYQPEQDSEQQAASSEQENEQQEQVGKVAVAAAGRAEARPAPPASSPTPAARPTVVPSPPASLPAARAEGGQRPGDGSTAVALRGAAGKIAQNMEASLGVPTATSIRNIPVKVLEENRRVINNHLANQGQSKASFTHIIAWAIVRALKDHPRMNSAFVSQDGTPARIDRQDVNLGIAIDVERKDGTRSLVVPNVKRSQSLDFATFLKAYNDVVRKARNNTLEISDFEGTTISLTNPGTIGTIASVPRLMPTQGTIIATGQIDFSAEYAGADASVLADLGISKVMTMTSTYDHRIIQGAESGAFLARVHELLIGAEGFYDDVYRDLRIPYEPVRWAKDHPKKGEDAVTRHAAVLQMINAYRVRGHLLADLDPLEYKVSHHPELDPAFYGLTVWDLDREFVCGGLCRQTTDTLRKILDTLRETYCGKIGPEYMHISETVQKKWLQDRMEPTRNKQPLDLATKRRILMKLNDAEAFERFLHTKYVGHKRFSLEGAESVIPMLDYLFSEATSDGVQEAVIGMAHRGRLNVLANTLGKSYEKIFHEFEGDIDPNTTQGSGDVKYHLGAEGMHQATSGSFMKLTLASNPSHLEAVDPIVEGMARAKQKLINDRNRAFVLPVLLHGDAAFAGQGVVAETLNLSQLKGYKTGGTIHVVINNQIGFTTGPESARSSVYATDVAKMVQAPIFHVNGDDPEACVRAMKLAYDFRQQFHKDVVIDMICYRRHGHNEGDEPSLTQPRMYKSIKEHRSVRKIYTEQLLRKGDIDPKEAEEWLDQFQAKLQEAFDRTKEQDAPPSDRDPLYTDEEVTGYQREPSPDTSITADALQKIGEALTTTPPSFGVHPKLKPILAKRRAMAEGKDPLDWAFAELAAFGSLLLDGYRVRLSGQDSGRGTFSSRHAILFDYVTGQGYVPLNALEKQTPVSAPDAEQTVADNALDQQVVDTTAEVNFSVYDSLLSEYGVLGFEYGYTVADPGTLVMWEAQFGDFMNGAQIIIDQFLSSAEEKWGQHSGLVMLLPHGYEGQGPEHSSARLERFLTLCAEGNMQVVYPTTPAQYFHALRRQMKNNPRKPLVVMTPKSLLRHPQAVSSSAELTEGRFEPVLPDDSSRSSATRVVITSGKVYFDLKNARDKANANVPILRLEQFYPFPQPMLAAELAKYPQATEMVWAQDEPRNMGAWPFLNERLQAILKPGQKLTYVGRPVAAAPATGSHHRHEDQQKALVAGAIG
ncbi:MAG TPA: multifunctional oxoglutarate decarboxylase/oxoglutarate dehydrogenase thiamine pyrophosphate-binding subunit/dihydrolipoyllysine-residue succinyltransferase subunit [Thermoanaerobaculia bacterium]|jgi:2-oxoglutarate dehydrogenase E1 component|nr:multifunctional oxoglutarate decarboxylase/oxoglutarate dehydrogenase thiamine pyrophosphate-binding subunit/dihydrolipoyllysine-residue succinyltransferase subunit [Thermoanaerobaculia bacterium]